MFTGSVDLSLTADTDILELYFDGKRVPVDNAKWPKVNKVLMPTRTKIIAIKFVNTPVSSALLLLHSECSMSSMRWILCGDCW
jgi:hypothetical protein